MSLSIRSAGMQRTLAVSLLGFAVACSGDENPVAPELSPPASVQVSQTTRASGGVALLVSWSAVPGAESYTVERDVVGDASGFTVLAQGVTETRYVDAAVQEGNTYQYRVRAVAGMRTSAPSDPRDYTIGVRRAELTGTISGVRSLSSDTVYLLRGTVTVAEGGELHIPAGTLLLGDVTTQPTALIVRQGGKLYADGTAEKPIVFTSSRPVGQRRRGDWGGVVLNGRSLCNFPAGECVGEGLAGPYGGDQVDDSSGRMTYVRIEFAGYEVSFGNELNGLTLNGVGRGTVLHHIQVHYGLDDGIEFFGGTVDLKYALVTGASDDSFDYSTGWQGRGQFWIAVQDPDDADNGFEVDNNEEDFNASPLTNPLIYNVTLVGKGPDGQGGTTGESTRGMLLRRGTGGRIYNAIITGFGTSGIDIDNQETVGRIAQGSFVVANSILFSNAKNFDGDNDGIDEEGILMRPEWANRVVDPGLTDPFNRAAPDFRPRAGAAALSGFASPPSDGFFEPVSFVGGVAPGGTPWYAGWTTFARN